MLQDHDEFPNLVEKDSAIPAYRPDGLLSTFAK